MLIRSTYTRNDGSGTFNELKHLQLTFTEEGFTDAGPVEILSGTGAYTGIVGHGVGVGGTNEAMGIGADATMGLLTQHVLAIGGASEASGLLSPALTIHPRADRGRQLRRRALRARLLTNGLPARPLGGAMPHNPKERTSG